MFSKSQYSRFVNSFFIQHLICAFCVAATATFLILLPWKIWTSQWVFFQIIEGIAGVLLGIAAVAFFFSYGDKGTSEKLDAFNEWLRSVSYDEKLIVVPKLSDAVREYLEKTEMSTMIRNSTFMNNHHGKHIERKLNYSKMYRAYVADCGAIVIYASEEFMKKQSFDEAVKQISNYIVSEFDLTPETAEKLNEYF